MLPVALSRDVLAIRCVEGYIIIGVGNQLRVFRASNHKFLKSIETFHDDVIHNIVKTSNKLIAFGGRHLSIFKFEIDSEEIIIERENSHAFDDWIIAAEFFSENSDHIYILFSHNNLHLFNTLTKKFRNVHCEERCISYGGYLSPETPEEILVFSCTVFQEILLWKVDNRIDYSSDVAVLHRLKGHKGVIFSVFYHPELKLITSTSDDRTIRLWKVVENDVNSISHSIEWKNVEVRLLTTMFGHTARVWKSIVTENNVISIGEDSLICIWSLTGALRNKIIAHGGAPIWSIDISPDKSKIITGGGDGGVTTWPPSSLKPPLLTPKFTYESKTPKFVSYLNSGARVVFLDGGDLLLYDQPNQFTRTPQPKTTISLPRLKSYCLTHTSPDRKKIAFASQDGHVIIYEEKILKKDSNERLHQVIDQKVVNSKIFSLHWLSPTEILVCGAQGALKILHLSQKNLEIHSEFTLPPSKECWTTSAIISSTLLICGDRTGSIIVYALAPSPSKTPKQMFPRIHGRLGVQSFGSSGGKIISTGRDGTLRYHRLLEDDSGGYLKPLHWRKMPMEWVSRSVSTNDDVYILGFKEIEFMIYSTRLGKLVLRVICGGGHRSWDCLFNDGTVNFTCIKDKQVHSMESVPIESSGTIIPGVHSKEVHSLAVLPTARHTIILSGSEDCSIRVSALHRKKSGHEVVPLDVYDGHISSVKKIEILNLEGDENFSRNLVFSGGGRAQLKVWEVNLNTDKETLGAEDVTGVELTSFMLRTDRDRRKCSQSSGRSYFLDPETRFMDISVQFCLQDENLVILFVACSDGLVRAFCYDIEGVNLFFVAGIRYFNRCVLKVHSFRDERGLILVSMATDGFINLWNVDFVVEEVLRKGSARSDEGGFGQRGVEPFGRWRAHQSGINSYDFLRNGEECFVASGGDDNKVGFSIFEILGSPAGSMGVRMKQQWESSEIHSAQITGIRFIPNDQLLTTAIDQRVVLYDYNYSNEKLSVTPKKIIQTFVSDLQGLTICRNPENFDETLAFVYGQGVEVLLLQNETKDELTN
ncbi:WD repeat-containing protein 6 [Diachasma alloeum]|uniref:WD repeat-containing protein 6 n=1 Tax=Diachasma alloeum TaxID=454923 RepID=UPI0007383128|nr:WD repeat-containing protein 6 [Diachasma alloeum]